MNDDPFAAWVRHSYPYGTKLAPSFLRELYEEELDRRARARADSLQAREMAALAKRVRYLEEYIKHLPEILGEAIPEVVAHVVEKNNFLKYFGVWDEERAYPANAIVTHAGSVWVTMAPAPAGEKPGRSMPWRLAAKGDRDRDPVVR